MRGEPWGGGWGGVGAWGVTLMARVTEVADGSNPRTGVTQDQVSQEPG